ncbi:DUF6086 family protein [Streptomyces sp. NPDC004609]|uniref:DUF6086 family protein n=1 Tax=Streptomyces sp. NPDC004609 TaxID=3364704 RepID=UPI00369AD4B0
MSQYYELGDTTLWNPSNGASRLFIRQVEVFEAELGTPSGIHRSEAADEYRIDPAGFELFVNALVTRHRRTSHGVILALSAVSRGSSPPRWRSRNARASRSAGHRRLRHRAKGSGTYRSPLIPRRPRAPTTTPGRTGCAERRGRWTGSWPADGGARGSRRSRRRPKTPWAPTTRHAWTSGRARRPSPGRRDPGDRRDPPGPWHLRTRRAGRVPPCGRGVFCRAGGDDGHGPFGAGPEVPDRRRSGKSPAWRSPS